MKKALFLLLLLPAIGFSQDVLVRWKGQYSSTSATTYNNNISSANFATSGINVSNDGWNGIQTTEWPVQTTGPDDNKYIQFTLSVATGYKVTLGAFNYTYVASGDGPNKITVKYSLNADFSSPETLVNGETPTFYNTVNKSISFNNVVLTAGKTVYVRVYGYARQNAGWSAAPYRFACTDNNGYANSGTYGQGPEITGTVALAGGVVAQPDTATVTSGLSKSINVTGNDTATGTTIASVVTTTATLPQFGSASISGNNIVYAANAGITTQKTDTFSYKITGADGSTATSTVTVTINPLVLPTAANDNATTTKGTAVNVNVMANDTYGSGTFSTLVAGTPSHGTAAVQANNTITYTPATGYAGTDSFTYTFTNSENNTATATVNVVVNVTPVGTSQLSGTYIITPFAQYEYQQFSTITAAVNHLNTYGISGPVTFLLNEELYNNASGESFPITFTTGQTSADKTVTIKPAPNKYVSIQANNAGTGVPAVFKFSGADYITIDGSNAGTGSKNLTILNKDTFDYVSRSLIWVTPNSNNNPAEHITVKNCFLKMGSKNGQSAYCVGVFSGANSVDSNNGLTMGQSPANNNYLTVENNTFISVKQGVYINGNGGNLTANTVVSNNIFGSESNTESAILPAYFNNAVNYTFTQNIIQRLYRDNSGGNLLASGIYVEGNSTGGTITRNTFQNLTKTVYGNLAGIYLASTSAAVNTIVANNFILDVAGYAGGQSQDCAHGIYVASGSGYKIYHNTVNLSANQNNGATFASALFVNQGVTGLDVRNNIFVVRQTTGVPAAIMVRNGNAMSSIFTNLDYNNYYCAGAKAFAKASDINDASYSSPAYITDLAAWQIATGFDAHSKSINPAFVSATDLHINVSAESNATITDAGTNAIYGTISKDIDGQLRNATTPDMGADEFGAATAPVASTQSGAANNPGVYCTESTTWNGTAWSNGDPVAEKDVIFNADYMHNGEAFNACSIHVLAGKNVLFTGECTVTVTHSVNVADTGVLTFDSSSHLVQVENDQNSGLVTIKRNGGLLRRLDYTLWSAPVTDFREGTSTVNGQTVTNYQSLQDFSPQTTSNRFYYYSSTIDLFTSYPSAATTKFTTGKSVLVRMPNVIAGNSQYNTGQIRVQFEGVFEGTPNNGDVNIALDNAGGGYNAVGNPYPSPIDITSFITENVENGAITGELWVWRKTNNSATSSYALVTLEGYTENSGDYQLGENTLASNPFLITPSGNCIFNTAQGFLVQTTGANKTLVFKNSMRAGNVHTNTFFRTANTTDVVPVQEGRYWLNLKGNDNFSQVMVGYRGINTDGYDNGRDGLSILDGNVNLYSLLPVEGDNLKMGILAKGGFAETDVVKLGFDAAAAGTYEFEFSRADGIFAQEQQVYLKDNMLGTTHNFANGAYSFTTGAGTFESRFELQYMPDGALDTETPVLDAKDVVVYRDGKQVKVTATESIAAVTVYDMLGKVVYAQNNIDNTTFATQNLTAVQQVLVVNVTLANKQVISKKIMID